MRDQKVAAKRADFILLVGGGSFVVTFLAIFMMTRDMHGSTNNARSGILGFLFGVPTAFVVAAFITAIAFQVAVDRGSFDEPDIDDEEEGPSG